MSGHRYEGWQWYCWACGYQRTEEDVRNGNWWSTHMPPWADGPLRPSPRTPLVYNTHTGRAPGAEGGCVLREGFDFVICLFGQMKTHVFSIVVDPHLFD